MLKKLKVKIESKKPRKADYTNTNACIINSEVSDRHEGYRVFEKIDTSIETHVYLA